MRASDEHQHSKTRPVEDRDVRRQRLAHLAISHFKTNCQRTNHDGDDDQTLVEKVSLFSLVDVVQFLVLERQGELC